MRLTEIRCDPRPIAIARIGLGLATIFNAAEMFALLTGIAGGKLALPVHPLIPPPSVPSVFAYLALSVLAGLAITVGWRTATAAALSTVLSVFVFLWDQQTYSSHRFLATLLVAYLVFAKSDTAWSVSPREGTVPWWPQLLMMTQLSVCYLFAAVSKMNINFVSGGPLSHWVWIPLPWWMFTLMAIGTIVMELILAFGLWLQSVRRFAVVLGLILHGSILVLMKDQTMPLFAFGLTCVCLYGLFIFRPTRQASRKAEPVKAPTP